MNKVKLGSILLEQKESVKSPDGNGMDLIGVSNEIGLHVSRAKRIDDLSRYKFIEMGWFAYNPMRVNVGSIGYVYKQEQIGIVSPDYVVFSCSDKILPEYLLYLLKSDEGIESINKNASGAVRKRLYFSDLARIEIVLPSIESQRRRLVEFRKIKDLSYQISEHKSAESLLSQLKQSILQEAIQGKLTADWRAERELSGAEVEPATELLKCIKAEKAQLIKDKKIKKEKPLPPITAADIPFELPEGWVWCRIQDISTLKSGNSYNYAQGSENDILYVKVGDMNIPGNFDDVTNSSNYFVYQDSMQKDLINPKSIIFPKRGGAIATNKRCNVLSKKILIDSNSMAIIPSKYIDFEFFSWWFKTIDLSTFGNEAVVPQVNNKDILPIPFPLAPFKEQKAIVEKVENLMQKCQALEQEIKTSEANAIMLMQAVLKEAFEGKKEVVEV